MGRTETGERVLFYPFCHSERGEESSVFNTFKILRYTQDDRKLTFSAVSDGLHCPIEYMKSEGGFL